MEGKNLGSKPSGAIIINLLFFFQILKRVWLCRNTKEKNKIFKINKMKKKLSLLGLLSFCSLAFSQVGINTQNPQEYLM